MWLLLVDLLMTISNGKLPAIRRIQPSLYRMLVDVVCSYIKPLLYRHRGEIQQYNNEKRIRWRNGLKTDIYLKLYIVCMNMKEDVAQTLQIFIFYFVLHSIKNVSSFIVFNIFSALEFCYSLLFPLKCVYLLLLLQ